MATEAAAILQGDYVDLRFVRSRSVCQMIVEFDISYGEKIVEMFGTPKPSTGVPVAVARLSLERKEEAEPGAVEPAPKPSAPGRSKRHFDEMPLSQQAALMCNTPEFQDWLNSRELGEFASRGGRVNVYDSETAAEAVRIRCRVDSRSELDRDPVASKLWCKLHDEFRASQLAMEHERH